MRCTGLPSDRKLSATLPQLSFLVHLRFIHILPSDLRKRDQPRTRSRKETGSYLLDLSDYFIGHIRVTLREVSTSVNGDASLIGRFDVQRSFRVEGVPAR